MEYISDECMWDFFSEPESTEDGSSCYRVVRLFAFFRNFAVIKGTLVLAKL